MQTDVFDNADSMLTAPRLWFDLVNDAIIVTDAEGHIRQWNRAAEQIYGWLRTEVIGQPIEQIIPIERVLDQPDIVGEPNDAIAQILQRDGVWQGLVIQRTQAGRTIVIEGSVSARFDDQGRITDYITICRDSSARYQAEQALRDSEERLRAIIENGFDCVSLVAPDWTITYLSPIITEMLGYTPDDFRTISMQALTHPDEWQGYVHFRERLIAAPSAREVYTARIRHRDGRWRWIERRFNNQLHNPAMSSIIVSLRDVSEQIEARQALEHERTLLRTLIDTIPDAIFAKDREGRFLLKNLADAHTMGASTPEETIGKTDFDYYPPALAEHYHAADQGVLTTGQVIRNHEEPIVNTTGRTQWISTTKAPLRDPQGQIIGLVGISHDITTRKQAEAALHASEHFAHATLDALSAHIAILDETGTIIAVNRAWQAFARANAPADTPDQVAEGSNYLSVCDQAYGQDADESLAMSAGIRTVMRGERADFSREYPCHAPDEQRWFVARVTRFVVDGTLRIVVAHENITVRKQTERALAHREAQFAGIIESAMDAIITVDAEQRIVLLNRAAEQVFGCVAADVFGQTLDRFIPPELHAAHRQHIPAFGHTGVTRRSMYSPGVLEALRADGTRFPIEASISQITVEGATFYTVILRDMSQRRELEAQLLHAQKMESVGRLAGGVAHDFNNLLMVIGGVTDLIREALPADHPVQADLIDVSTAAERAAALTRQLLVFARRQILAPRVLDINTLVQETAPLLHRLLGEDIAVLLDLLPSPLPVRADPNQLQQVLINLAVNARDAMPAGGLLRISTRLTTRSDLVQGADTTSSAAVRIIVQDTGVGIPPEVLSRIFEPFFTTKAVGHGTGLGLAISYGIIMQHGGQIAVQSQVGEGAAFTVALPTVDAIPEAVASPPPIGVLPGGSETILVVEDEGAVRAFVERVLRALGYTVLFAQDGLDALQLAQRGRAFDLLLTDMVMPGLHGSALADQLTARQPHLRVIYMSGYAEHATLPAELLAQGVLLQKPFTAGTLARLVRTVLEQAPDA